MRTLSPTLIQKVKRQVILWNRELANPWHPSLAAKQLAQGLRNSCPTMAKLLEEARILEPWAEMLHDQVLELKEANGLNGMTPSEAESQARMELIPSNPEMEAEWLETETQADPATV